MNVLLSRRKTQKTNCIQVPITVNKATGQKYTFNVEKNEKINCNYAWNPEIMQRLLLKVVLKPKEI